MRFFLPARFCFALYLLWSAGARAETPSQVENPQSARRAWVSDGASVIDSETEARLNTLLGRLEKSEGAEIAVVTVRNLGGQDVESFASELFRRWGIGKQGRDNGVLILAAIEDRKYRIEVGYGLEGELTDGKAGALARETLPPAFRRGAYGAGLFAATVAVVREIAPNLVQSSAPANPNRAAPRESFPGSPARQTNPPRPSFSGSQPSNSPFQPTSTPNFSGLWIVFLFLGGGVVLLITLAGRPPRCEKCKGEMDQLGDADVYQMLSHEQQFEEDIESRDYQIWKCKTCAHQQMRVVRGGRSLGRCPHCQLHTLSSQTQMLQYPTEWSTGLEVTTEQCLWPRCRHHNTRQRILARRPRVHVISGGGFGGSGGGASSGGGSFGGGSSGGGGASGNW